MDDVAQFLLTSFNVKLPYLKGPAPDDVWLRKRFDLFERFCFPSVASQTNRDFKWLVFFDEKTSEAYRKRIGAYRQLETFHPIFFSGCRDTNHIKDYIRKAINKKCRTVVTTHLDNDDAISKDYMAMVRGASHSSRGSRYFINIRNGYVWFKERIYRMTYPCNPFFSVVEPLDVLSTVISYDHTEINQHGSVLDLSHPGAYLQVVHDCNLLNSKPRIRCRVRKSRLYGYFDSQILGSEDSMPDYWTEKASEKIINPIKKLRRTARNILMH